MCDVRARALSRLEIYNYTVMSDHFTIEVLLGHVGEEAVWAAFKSDWLYRSLICKYMLLIAGGKKQSTNLIK